MLSALPVMEAALVQKWVSAATRLPEISAAVAETAAARVAVVNFIFIKSFFDCRFCFIDEFGIEAVIFICKITAAKSNDDGRQER